MLLKKDKRQKKISKKIWGTVIAVVTILVICFYFIMTSSGSWLLQNDEFHHVKWIAVLDGQTAELERTDYAAKLVREHKADSVLILGRRVYRNHSNAEFYAEDFMKQGAFDSNAVFIAMHDDPSTFEEARTIIPWFKKRNADTVLLVTYSAATKRAAKIFNTLAGGKPHFIVTEGNDYIYTPSSWFASRESRKIWIKEWAAMLVAIYELWNVDTLGIADSTYLKPIRSLAEENREGLVDLQKMLPALKRKIDTLKAAQAQDSTQVDSLPKDSSQAKADSARK
jgi:uncharacterized SAM-binding protein YcdF (DUF218 family)